MLLVAEIPCADAQGVEDDSLAEALHEYADFVENALDKIIRLSQFRHVELVTVDTSEEVPEVRGAGSREAFDPPAAALQCQLWAPSPRCSLRGQD